MYEQIAQLIAAQYNIKLKLTPEEWKKRQVSKETLESLGLKGSPKLSKVLVSLGIPEKRVNLILGAKMAPNSSFTRVNSDQLSCLEQGNSLYFKSCQATDSRSKWGAIDIALNKLKEDLPFMGKSLFLWTVGEPMAIDGSGFRARAKIRVVYTDDSTSKVVGLYIDRVYGQVELLLSHLQELEKWSLDHFGEEIPLLEIGEEIRGYVPSVLGGYQDTLRIGFNGFNNFKKKTKKTLLYQAYNSRNKECGVYLNPLKAVEINFQKENPFSSPIQKQEVRGYVPDFLRPVIRHYCLMIGKPEEKINYAKQGNKHSIEIRNKINQKECRLIFHNKIYEFFIEEELIYRMEMEKGLCKIYAPFKGFLPPIEIPYKYSKESIKVLRDIPGFGFMKAEPFPIKDGIVLRDIPEYGFMEAKKLPYNYSKTFGLRVVRDIPDYGWMKPELI